MWGCACEAPWVRETRPKAHRPPEREEGGEQGLDVPGGREHPELLLVEDDDRLGQKITGGGAVSVMEETVVVVVSVMEEAVVVVMAGGQSRHLLEEGARVARPDVSVEDHQGAQRERDRAHRDRVGPQPGELLEGLTPTAHRVAAVALAEGLLVEADRHHKLDRRRRRDVPA